MLAPWFVFPVGIGAFKLYQNFFPETREEGSHQTRKNTIAHGLMSGSNPRVAQMSDKQFEKFVRTNSVGKSCESQLREARSKHLNQNEAPDQALGA